VLIPTANRDALMLRSDVVEAIEAGKFHVFEAATVEDGIELLTGVPAGEADALGHYPEGSVFGAAEARLKRFYQAMMELGRVR
jgi:predicted ATP-dependent protease